MTIPLIPHQGDEFLKYRTDWSSYTGFAPGPVVFPRSVEEVVELVRWANGNHARGSNRGNMYCRRGIGERLFKQTRAYCREVRFTSI